MTGIWRRAASATHPRRSVSLNSEHRPQILPIRAFAHLLDHPLLQLRQMLAHCRQRGLQVAGIECVDDPRMLIGGTTRTLRRIEQRLVQLGLRDQLPDQRSHGTTSRASALSS
ncbi:hypothetical protein QFZ91_006166 [Paraburkholderia sp. JPY419]